MHVLDHPRRACALVGQLSSCAIDARKGLAKFVSDTDASIAVVEIEDQALEEATVELGAYVRPRLRVEIVRALSEGYPSLRELHALSEVVFVLGDPLLDTAALQLDVVHQVSDLVLGR